MKIVYHPDYLKHFQTAGHPEAPRRLEAIVGRLKAEGLFNNVLKPEPAIEKMLELVHERDYIEKIKNFGEGYYDMDTYIRPETYRIASLAAGGAILASNHASEHGEPVLALLRPPGHHAGATYAGGFCYFNNVALSAQHLLKHGMKRIAIIDPDLHHGNGTADIFNQRNDVLYISTHLYGIYPGTGSVEDVGKGEGEGFTVNIPFTFGCGDASFKSVFERVIEPIIGQYKPDTILVSLGLDAHYCDPLGGLTLSSQGYLDIVSRCLALANTLCNGKIAFMLEGGYEPDAISEVCAGIVGSAYNKKVELKFTRVADVHCAGRDVIERVARIQKKYWQL